MIVPRNFSGRIEYLIHQIKIQSIGYLKLKKCLIYRFREDLTQFLERCPQIGWHHAAVSENFESSARILLQLADREEQLADDKKFFLAIAKLEKLAASDPNQRANPDENEFVQDVDKVRRTRTYVISELLISCQ